MNSRQLKDRMAGGAIYLSAGFTIAILAVIILFIVIKGAPGINLAFLTSSYENSTTYVTCDTVTTGGMSTDGRIESLGINVSVDVADSGVKVTSIDSGSPLKTGMNGNDEVYAVKKGDVLTKIGSVDIKDIVSKVDANDSAAVQSALEKVAEGVNAINENSVRVKVTRIGGGILPMLVTTIYMILLSLLIAAPIGILAAVYLNEYAKAGKLLKIIHFAIENLAGIPSIIYGLFGSLFFVQVCHMQYSLLAGAMTVSIILLPTIITTTEEALKTIPRTYRESSLGLGATKLQTINKVVLPNAIPGILVAVLLSIGRIVGESAALLLTAGTVAQIPGALWGNSASGATLTIKAYTLMKEENDLTTACAIGIILLAIIIVINFASKMVTKKFLEKRSA